jgi:hypothetical protein
MILGPNGIPIPEASSVAPLKPRTGARAFRVPGTAEETPKAARVRAASIMERMQWQLEAYGGIESLDFLDMPLDLFETAVFTLWWGRKYA